MEIKASKIEVLQGLTGTKLIVDVEGKIGAADKDKLTASDKPWRINIKRWREKRSNDSNAYAWVLMTEIAKCTNKSVNEVYRDIIKEVSAASEIIPVIKEAAPTLVSGWEHNGLGWQAEIMPSDSDEWVTVILWYGSSAFDTAQMSRFIDLIIQDCQALGIETLPPDKLAAMLGAWGNG